MTPYTKEERAKAQGMLLEYYSIHGKPRARIDLQCDLTRAEAELERLRKRESEARELLEDCGLQERYRVHDFWKQRGTWLSATATEPKERR